MRLCCMAWIFTAHTLLVASLPSTVAWSIAPLLLRGAGQVITTWWREEASSMMAWCLGTDRLASSCRQEGMGTGGDPLCRANGSCLHVSECVWSGLGALVRTGCTHFTSLVGTFYVTGTFCWVFTLKWLSRCVEHIFSSKNFNTLKSWSFF